MTCTVVDHKDGLEAPEVRPVTMNLQTATVNDIMAHLSIQTQGRTVTSDHGELRGRDVVRDKEEIQISPYAVFG